MKTALIVVDVQQFFLHNAPNDLPGKIFRHSKDKSYDAIAFTVFCNTPDSNFVRSLKWDKCSGKKDIQIPKPLTAYISKDNVFTRNTYSGFKGTALNDYLAGANIEKVVLCGVDTDACVLATAFDAFDNGYLVGIESELTYSDGGLETEAQAIMRRSLLAR